MKILHPDGPPSDDEFFEYVGYAIECRRRVKEQMNKRKPDDEFALIDLSYFDASGHEVVVHCPETKGIAATLEPSRRRLSVAGNQAPIEVSTSIDPVVSAEEGAAPTPPAAGEDADEELQEQHFTINYGDVGHTYDTIIGPYLRGAKGVVIEDPYIRAQHQIANFVRFCETVVKTPTVRRIHLVTSTDDKTDVAFVSEKMDELKQSLLEIDVELTLELNQALHDREIRIDNGWIVKIGRGLDFYQRPDGWFAIGANDFSLRRCLETKVDVFQASSASERSVG